MSKRKVISDMKFLEFEWPPKMPSFSFKKKPEYIHSVLVSSNEHDAVFVLNFTSEKKAREYKRSAEKATNNITTGYERKEAPVFNDLGLIEQ